MKTIHKQFRIKDKYLVIYPVLAVVILFTGCKTKSSEKEITTVSVEVLDPAIAEVFDTLSPIEVLGEGFTWSEGPLWVESMQMLLFTDVPENKIYSWDTASGVKEYLYPSGLDSLNPVGGAEGANGLALSAEGKLLLCQHGNRALASMLAPLSEPKDSFTFLARKYNNKRLNSPNDLHIAKNGDIYFTDPPYGLPNQDDDKNKEIAFNGVYRLSATGKLTLLDSMLSRPNGIALSPDENTLYVANSDPQKALWIRYRLDQQKNINERTVFADMTHLIPAKKGLPDGMKISKKGTIFATGPGGILVFHTDGRHLGTILTGEATANCALDEQEKWLYMTAHGYLKRIRLK
jgi:gluconolactonase